MSQLNEIVPMTHGGAPRVGQMIAAKYRLEKKIGQGAAGEVWLANHVTIGRSVAIKLLRNANKGRAAIRFVQEARLAAQVQSRFVVSIFDFGSMEDGTMYMVMEHLHGETLGDRLNRNPPMSVKELVRLVTQSLSGLAAVHAQGIVHRDLKPENVFLVKEAGEFFPKLLDFGVSRGDESNPMGPQMAKLTATGMTVGTPLFMSPEQARGLRDLDGRCDIYSLGVIAYRALSGEVPFHESNVLDLLMRVVSSTEAPALSDVRPDLGEPLSKAVQAAMSPSRNQRFATVEEMQLALHSALQTVPEGAMCAEMKAPSDDKISISFESLGPVANEPTPGPEPIAPPVSGWDHNRYVKTGAPSDGWQHSSGDVTHEGPPRGKKTAVVAGGAALLLSVALGGWAFVQNAAPPIAAPSVAAAVGVTGASAAPVATEAPAPLKKQGLEDLDAPNLGEEEVQATPAKAKDHSPRKPVKRWRKNPRRDRAKAAPVKKASAPTPDVFLKPDF